MASKISTQNYPPNTLLNTMQNNVNFLITNAEGNINLKNTNTGGDSSGVDFFFNQESPYKYPALVICDDSKRINANSDIYQKYSDVIYDECGNRFNIRNMKDSAGILQQGYSQNIDLDSHMKNINFYKDRCYYDNWKMEPKALKPCNGLKRNADILVKDYTPVGKHNGECISNCDKEVPCYNTPPSDINCETDIRKRYEFKYNKFKTESCINPADKITFKRAPTPEVYNLEKYPNAQREQNLVNILNQGKEHDYYQFFESNKCKIYPAQRLFNNITRRKCLPSHQFVGDIGPQYLK